MNLKTHLKKIELNKVLESSLPYSNQGGQIILTYRHWPPKIPASLQRVDMFELQFDAKILIPR